MLRFTAMVGGYTVTAEPMRNCAIQESFLAHHRVKCQNACHRHQLGIPDAVLPFCDGSGYEKSCDFPIFVFPSQNEESSTITEFC